MGWHRSKCDNARLPELVDRAEKHGVGACERCDVAKNHQQGQKSRLVGHVVITPHDCVQAHPDAEVVHSFEATSFLAAVSVRGVGRGQVGLHGFLPSHHHAKVLPQPRVLEGQQQAGQRNRTRRDCPDVEGQAVDGDHFGRRNRAPKHRQRGKPIRVQLRLCVRARDIITSPVRKSPSKHPRQSSAIPHSAVPVRLVVVGSNRMMLR